MDFLCFLHIEKKLSSHGPQMSGPQMSGPQMSVRKCRSGKVGPQMSVRKCRSAKVGPQMSVRKCRSANVGPQKSVRICLVRKCRSANVGPQMSYNRMDVSLTLTQHTTCHFISLALISQPAMHLFSFVENVNVRISFLKN